MDDGGGDVCSNCPTTPDCEDRSVDTNDEICLISSKTCIDTRLAQSNGVGNLEPGSAQAVSGTKQGSGGGGISVPVAPINGKEGKAGDYKP